MELLLSFLKGPNCLLNTCKQVNQVNKKLYANFKRQDLSQFIIKNYIGWQ
jgi:hypothetical protein